MKSFDGENYLSFYVLRGQTHKRKLKVKLDF